MRIELRDQSRRRLGRIEVDPALRPTRVTVAAADGRPPREVFLEWDTAVDDAGHLRRCVSCGCHSMFRMRSFPQVTVFIVVLAFAGSVVALLGYATDPVVLALLLTLLTVDVAILLLSRRQLICYRCRTTYSNLPIARYHRSWDRTEAERHPAEPAFAPASMAPGVQVDATSSSPTVPTA